MVSMLRYSWMPSQASHGAKTFDLQAVYVFISFGGGED